jgi:hypothetical protein
MHTELEELQHDNTVNMYSFMEDKYFTTHQYLSN